MKFYEEKFFNRRNWMMENLYKLNLNTKEQMTLLLIDFFNEYHMDITLNLLSEKTNMSMSEVDETINSLCSKGYVQISTKQLKPVFVMDSIFEAASNAVTNSNIYDLFESEFGKVLSQKDVSTISEWLRIYSYDQIVDALREAMINNKKSIRYIDKILAEGEKNDQ